MKFIRKEGTEWVDPATIKIDPRLDPKRDDRWMELAEKALSGAIPVFWGMVPIGNIVPFDLDFRPDLHEAGMAAIRLNFADAKEGRFTYPVVYQRGYWFVVSDDYVPFFSALLGMPDYVGCFIMGEPNHPLVKELKRVVPEDVKAAIFGSSERVPPTN